MFRKLLKHEWKATAGTLGLLSLAALGVGLLGGVILRVLSDYPEQVGALASAGLALALFFIFFALIAYVAAVEIILLVQFYKSRFTDQGYLTFTLPVSSHQIFLSSALNLLIWTAIAAVVLVVSVTACFAIGIPWQDVQDIGLDLTQEFPELFQIDTSYIVVTVLQTVIGTVYGIVMTMTCLTLGAVIAKKHKIIAAFVAYYAVSFLTGTVSSLLTASFTDQIMDYAFSAQAGKFTQMYYQALTQSMALTMVWEIVLIVLGYLLSTHLMKKKLNLP